MGVGGGIGEGGKGSGDGDGTGGEGIGCGGKGSTIGNTSIDTESIRADNSSIISKWMGERRSMVLQDSLKDGYAV